ncbi:CRM-domain containing factor CFM3, chloroplastic/mitochondrial [Euphorbia lathyris]|uniref:CRM-domain containing factor CFM3, chloroplastic/mitochondrial n=1 Tax=Euphorbia lathyris TaxID=212925 RepID=UPI0033135596
MAIITTAKLTELPFRKPLPFTSHSLFSFTARPSIHSFKKPLSSSSSSSSSSSLRTERNPKPNNSKSPWLSKWDPPNPSSVQNSTPPAKVTQSNVEEKPRYWSKDKGQNAIERIVLRLRNLGIGSDDEDEEEDEVEDFNSHELAQVTGEERLTDLLQREWVRPDTIFSNDKDGESDYSVLPWERKEDERKGREAGEGAGGRERIRTAKAPTLAELTLEDEELRRLRRIGMFIRERISVPKAGLTKEVMEKIHDTWRKQELVRLKFHEVLAHDMKTAHEITERRTGGLVIWKAGSVMMVYRGTNYEGPPSKSQSVNRERDALFVPDVSSAGTTATRSENVDLALEKKEVVVRRSDFIENMTEEEAEFNSLLDELGPRFEGYWGTGILPVDADLLPPKVPGYKTPFRLLPTGMRSRLTNAEMTNLRKVAKSIPCHFALGRNRNHQGLALAIIKLWEKSLIAKIAVKRGIQNTNNKLMADEIKTLTGGVLLLRNKYYIVIYRGKDFLPTSVAAALAERQELTKQIQDAEEKERNRGVEATSSGEVKEKALAGTLAEFYEAQAQWGREISAEERERMMEDASRAKTARIMKRIEHKLYIAQAKKQRAERLLAKVEASMIPSGPDYDQETITDEERAMFRRVGLRMKAYLPIGIRGVFDGVIENMHLHWKHRELVKLISKQKTLAFLEDTARLLEFESGGILVAIERVPKGFALIYYRGKNYQRPIKLRPRNLLTKAKALKRSVAMQRHEALSQHIAELESTIEQMKKEIGFSLEEGENSLTSEEQAQLNHVSELSQSEDEDEDEDSLIGSEEGEDDSDDDDDSGIDWEADGDFELSDFENDDRPLTKNV